MLRVYILSITFLQKIFQIHSKCSRELLQKFFQNFVVIPLKVPNDYIVKLNDYIVKKYAKNKNWYFGNMTKSKSRSGGNERRQTLI